MLKVFCPHCAESREEAEFHCVGQAHLARPRDPDNCTDQQWGNYLYFRKNPRGIYQELWVHAAGCRKFFNITRDTQSYQIMESYRIGQTPSVTAESREPVR